MNFGKCMTVIRFRTFESQTFGIQTFETIADNLKFMIFAAIQILEHRLGWAGLGRVWFGLLSEASLRDYVSRHGVDISVSGGASWAKHAI